MSRPGVRTPVRHLSKGLLAVVIACCLMLITTVSVLANTVNISDQAGVLDQNRVRSEGSNLAYPLNIYTTNRFQGSLSAFQQQSATHVTSTNLIVMAIDTVNHHFYTAWGKNVPLSGGDATSAANAFKNSFNNGDYTGATVASIQSLAGALSSRGNSSGGSNPVSSSGGGLLSGGLTTLCCVGLLILIIGAIIFGVMRRRGGMGRRMAPGGPMGMGTPYQQPYPPNYYGPGGYNQGGGGMNPLAAGGLGAAAGGLIGYELGKEQGENQRGGNYGGDGGNYGGGGGGGDFGGGGGGDFGGGGGGDFGGGGGGGDFGGGGGGSF